jgi:hypothetical protein
LLSRQESNSVVAVHHDAADAGQFRVKTIGVARFVTHLCRGSSGSTDVIKASGEGNNAVSL